MSGWPTENLGDVCRVRRGSVITKKKANPGDVPVIAGGIGPAYFHDTANRDANVITVSGSGANAGFVNFFDRPIWASDCSTIEPNNPALDVRYVHLFLLNMQRFINENLRQGAAQPHVYPKDLAKLEIPLPPMEEQKRIVAVLDQAFAAFDRARANAEANLADAEELLSETRERLLDPDQPAWRKVPLSDLISIKHGFAFKSEFFTTDGDLVLLTPGNFFEGGGFRHRGSKQKYYEGDVPEGFVLCEGDLLMAMTEQAPGLLGSCILVPESERFLHNQRLGLIQPLQTEEWHSGFYAHVFNTKPFRKALSDTCTGIKVRHTSPDKIKAVSVPMPPSLADQLRLSDRLDDLVTRSETLKAIYHDKLTELGDLRQSILQKVFAGELT